MKLSAVQIREYKSIRDSNSFDIGNVTCLVGKNEAGKTALLQSIYKLNPIVPEHGKFDITDDYPRADVEEYRQQIENKSRSHATAVSATFSLEPDDLADIVEDYGQGALKDPIVIVRKGYDNTLRFQFEVNEARVGKHLLSRTKVDPDFHRIGKTWSTLQELADCLASRAALQTKEFSDAVAKANALEDADEKTRSLAEAQALAEPAAAKGLRDELTKLLKTGLKKHIWDNYLAGSLPKFFYFDEYYQMDGHLNIQKLKERQAAGKLLDSDRPMMGLIELARMDLDQLIAPQRTEELVSKLEGASNHLTKQVLKYWSQNKHLTVRFDVRPAQPNDPEGMRDGTNLWGRVYDSIHLVSTLLGTRSRGFVWFFSFLAWFSQQKKKPEPLILLLDEPGLFLHGTAQGDLLRYIEEELKPHHQVIYTTHSPFMVDPKHFERVRIVHDQSMDAKEILPPEKEGTKVVTDVFAVDEESLFPLQGALGYEISQTLFVGPDCLVVEGPSDLLYLQTMSAILGSLDRQVLDGRWTITPVGGADKVPTFVALLGAQKGINIATLIDFTQSSRQKIENLYKAKLLEKQNVLTFADFTGRTEADIEDLFEANFYLSLVNSEFVKVLAKPIGEAELPPGDRLLARLEAYFQAHPMTNNVKFNHYRPARYFVEKSSSLAKQISEPCLARFETIFTRLNALLR